MIFAYWRPAFYPLGQMDMMREMIEAKNQIDFVSVVRPQILRTVVLDTPVIQRDQNLVDDPPFPTHPDPRLNQEFLHGTDTQKAVKQSAVTPVDLGAFYQPLPAACPLRILSCCCSITPTIRGNKLV
jgi:hypothetical protein